MFRVFIIEGGERLKVSSFKVGDYLDNRERIVSLGFYLIC